MARTFDYDFATGTLQDSAARPHGDEVLHRLEHLATILDTALVIPGTNIRFGADALIGIIPALGDLITTGLSAYIVYEAHRMGAPKRLVARMIANVMFDSAISAVPVAGNIADVFFRANKKNVRMLREWWDNPRRRR